MSERGRSPAPSGQGQTERRSSQSLSRSGSRSASGSRPTSPARSAAVGAGPGGFVKGPGFDPARMGSQGIQEKGNTRMELPPDAYVSDTKKDMFALRGNRLNSEGKPAQVQVNQLRMSKFDFQKKIYQYDVSSLSLLFPRGAILITLLGRRVSR